MPPLYANDGILYVNADLPRQYPERTDDRKKKSMQNGNFVGPSFAGERIAESSYIDPNYNSHEKIPFHPYRIDPDCPVCSLSQGPI